MPDGPERMRDRLLLVRVVLRYQLLPFGIDVLRSSLLPVGNGLRREQRVLPQRTVLRRHVLLPVRYDAMRQHVLSGRRRLPLPRPMRLQPWQDAVPRAAVLQRGRELHRHLLLCGMQRAATSFGHAVHITDEPAAVPAHTHHGDKLLDHVVLYDIDHRVPPERRCVHDRKPVLLAQLLRRAVRSRRLHLTTHPRAGYPSVASRRRAAAA